MKKYNELYDFRLATTYDINNIMDFIGKNWKENHILSWDKELFLWQYGNTEYEDYHNINVVLMIDKKDIICGMIGFIPYSKDQSNLHVSTAITIVKKDCKVPMIGVELMKQQHKLVGEKINFSSGANPKTIVPIFEKIFHHKVGIMQQYYMLNPEVDRYNISVVPRKSFLPVVDNGFKLQEVENFEIVQQSFDIETPYPYMSYKSKEFIRKRYFEHPIYQYHSWIIKDKDSISCGIIFAREIKVREAKILRIVDYRGNLEVLYKIGKPIKDLLIFNAYEYIDFMVDYLPPKNMEKAGFNLLNPDGDNIIPHYFEPFIQRNIKNYYQKNGEIVIFKADGDQDRPNAR